MRHKIQPRLHGGLGNQMFQIAAAMGMGDKWGRDLVLSCDWNHGAAGSCGNPPSTYVRNIYSKLPMYRGQIKSHNIVTDITENNLNKPYPGTGPIRLSGYFQDPRYWAHISGKVKKSFDLSWHENRIVAQKPICAIHFRGLDYYRVDGYHNVCTDLYYLKAIEMVKNDYHLVLFTNDIERANAMGITYDKIFDPDNKLADYHHFAAMAGCDAIIMANSSFSWWAHFLGTTKELVISPSKWYGPAGPQYESSLILPHFKQIDP